MAVNNLRPIRKFSSFFDSGIQYQCAQTCYPNIPSQPIIMVELCNKICPFKPSTPGCQNCAKIYAQTVGPVFNKKSLHTQPESVVVDPDTHAILFTPEIVVNGVERKQCCYLDQCLTVPFSQKCEPVCYEPCDSVCTDRCQKNPQCPDACDDIRKEQFKLRYRIWLANKLNEVKQKYKAVATACLLRTRLSFVTEIQKFYNDASSIIGNVQLLADESADNANDSKNDE